MWLSDVSVKRPVFATVISMLLIAFGAISYNNLQVREYPDVTTATVSISTTYTGASASVIETQITQVLEDSVSAVEGIDEIRSSSSDGRSRITIDFDSGRDIDIAANDVRDQISRTVNRLPEEVDLPIVSKSDSDARPVTYVMVTSTNLEPVQLRDYADRYILDELSILPGVSSATVNGAGRPAIRVWLDRLQLAAREMTVVDVQNALRRENVELPGGRIDSVDREFPVRLSKDYVSANDFANLVIRRGDNGELIRLGDVAKIEQSSSDLRNYFSSKGKPTISIGVIKQSTANTVEVLDGVKSTVARLQANLPPNITMQLAFDDSVFITAAISAVYTTIFLTVLLVGLVIWIFLGSLRSVLVPMATIPVCLIATFSILAVFGYSINLITLLALTLAIGLVVDDSIVVLENIHRRVEKGEPPLLAAFKGVKQVAFAVIATTAVLLAVFTPIMFLEDNMGVIFSELAVTICAAVVFSSVLALSLAPMLSSKILTADLADRKSIFDRGFQWLETKYKPGVEFMIRHPWIVLPMMAAMCFGIVYMWQTVPQEYAPSEDKGMFLVRLTAPVGTGYEKMVSKIKQAEAPLNRLVEEEIVGNYGARVPGFGGTSTNSGVLIVRLNPERDTELYGTTKLMGQLSTEWSQIPGFSARAFQRQGLSSGGGNSPLSIVLQGPSYEALAEWRDILFEQLADYPGLGRLNSDLEINQPQVIVSIDKARAAALGVSAETVGSTLQTMMSERTITTYEIDGEEYDVIMQATDEQRSSPNDLLNTYVRSDSGAMIPMANLVSIENKAGIESLNRFNRVRSVNITGSLANGYTLGDVLTEVERIVREDLPEGAVLAYREESAEYKDASSNLIFVFGMAMLILFLVLAAQFESFVHPFVIMFTVPMAIFGGVAGLLITGNTMNIFSQIGILMLIGIATKNGILIVEFINQMRDLGTEFKEAIVQASMIRLRPVLMTTLSTTAGAIPLIVATGAGSESRSVLGVVIFFGVSFAAMLTLFVVPAIYCLIAKNTDSPEAVARELESLQSQT